MVDNIFTLYGEKVIVSSLERLNLESYLSTYKRASAFSKAYEMMPDFWENRRKCIEEYVDGEREDRVRYLIIEKISSEGCGYIELDYGNPEMPEVDIAIIEEYQRKGYAYDAARVLLKHVLEKETVKHIIWNAFSSNKASCKIAEKLGGVAVDGKNLIMEAMCAAGLNMDSMDGNKIPKTVTYEIKRSNS